MNITFQICCFFSQHNSKKFTLEDTWGGLGYKTWPESSCLDCWVFSWLYYFWSCLILEWGNVLAQEVGYYCKTLNVLSCVQFLFALFFLSSMNWTSHFLSINTMSSSSIWKAERKPVDWYMVSFVDGVLGGRRMKAKHCYSRNLAYSGLRYWLSVDHFTIHRTQWCLCRKLKKKQIVGTAIISEDRELDGRCKLGFIWA